MNKNKYVYMIEGESCFRVPIDKWIEYLSNLDLNNFEFPDECYELKNIPVHIKDSTSGYYSTKGYAVVEDISYYNEDDLIEEIKDSKRMLRLA